MFDTKICLPKDYSEKSYASAIRTYNNIYVANRGHNSIFKYSTVNFIDCVDRKGKTPRDFIFCSNRLICANPVFEGKQTASLNLYSKLT